MYKKIKSIRQQNNINFLNNNNYLNNSNYLLENRINRNIMKENALYDFYIINLIKRTDRYDHIVNQFKDYNINL